jgi:glycosidase
MLINKRMAALPLVVLMLGLGACNNANQPVQEKASQEQPPVEKAKQSIGSPIPDWSKNSVMYEVNVRQYTKEGTFKAFEAHLPRLKELGVDILWFMPIHPISKKNRIGTLGSYYAVQDYKAINPEFGTSEDFKALVEKAHEMGFKVLIDWVGNHTGWDNAWTSHPEWYTTNSEGNIVIPPGTNWQDVADLNYGNADMQAAMMDAMKYWVKEFDIDGYRADYASGVPTAFWESARGELEKIKPVYMLAEDDTQIKLLRHAFNSNYGWELYNLMNGIAKGLRDAEQVKLYAARMEKQYPEGTYPLQFTSNHDENSWTGTEYERLGEAVKAMAALSFTVPGMPLIYSGQEAGLNKRLQFFDKDEISWDDLTMQPFYQELIRLKHDNPALWNGKAGGVFNSIEADDTHILVFERKKDDNTVIVVMNLSAASVKGTIKAGTSAGTYKTFPSQTTIDLKEEQSIVLGPWEYRIYTKDLS